MIKLPIASFLARLSKKERMIFFMASCFVALALLDRALLSPILSKIDLLDEETELSEATIKKSLTILTQVEKIQEQKDKYEPYLSVPEAEEKEITKFLKEIENLAKESSVYLVGIRPSDSVQEGISKQYFLVLDFEAQMEQIFKFFHAIESSDKLFKIERYHIRSKSEESSIATCSMHVSKVIIPTWPKR